MTCNTIYHVVTALYDIDMVCHGMSPKKTLWCAFKHLHQIYAQTIYHKSAWILWYSTPNRHQLMLNLCTAASCAARPALAKCQAATRCDCKLQVASGIIAGFSTELCDFTTVSPHSFFLYVKLKYSMENSMLSTRRKEKEMSQTKKSYTEITNQHRPSSCSLALRFTSSFCAKCKGKDIGADAATVGSIFFSTGRQRRTKYSGRTCSADSTSTCFAQSVGHGDDTKSYIYKS